MRDERPAARTTAPSRSTAQPLRPERTCTISAAMLTASSAGVSAPMPRPIGVCTPAMASSLKPASASAASMRARLRAAAHDADVAGAQAQRLLEHAEVVHVPARDDDDVGALVHADGRERALERPHDDLGAGEPLRRGELLAVVDDDDAEAQAGEQRRHGAAHVTGAADDGQRRRVDALHDGDPSVGQGRRAVERGGGR